MSQETLLAIRNEDDNFSNDECEGGDAASLIYSQDDDESSQTRGGSSQYKVFHYGKIEKLNSYIHDHLKINTKSQQSHRRTSCTFCPLPDHKMLTKLRTCRTQDCPVLFKINICTKFGEFQVSKNNECKHEVTHHNKGIHPSIKRFIDSIVPNNKVPSKILAKIRANKEFNGIKHPTLSMVQGYVFRAKNKLQANNMVFIF